MHQRICMAAAVLCSLLPFLEPTNTWAQDRNAVFPEVIADLFPGYVLMDVADLNPDVQLVLSIYDLYSDGQSPTWVRADFDGNGVTDHAVLLRTSPGSTPEDEVFVLLLGFESGRYEIAHSQSFGSVNDRVLLQHFQAGKWAYPVQSYDTGKEATQMVNDAVLLEYAEASAAVYFWDDAFGEFDVIPVSD